MAEVCGLWAEDRAADNDTLGVYKSTDGGATWSATGLTFAKSSECNDNPNINSSNKSIKFYYASMLHFHQVHRWNL